MRQVQPGRHHQHTRTGEHEEPLGRDGESGRLRRMNPGCDGAYLQHLVHEDLETVELIGRQLAPLVSDA